MEVSHWGPNPVRPLPCTSAGRGLTSVYLHVDIWWQCLKHVIISFYSVQFAIDSKLSSAGQLYTVQFFGNTLQYWRKRSKRHANDNITWHVMGPIYWFVLTSLQVKRRCEPIFLNILFIGVIRSTYKKKVSWLVRNEKLHDFRTNYSFCILTHIFGISIPYTKFVH